MNYDYSCFHPECSGVSVVSGPNGPVVVCPDCRVAADLEGVSGKVSAADAVKKGKGKAAGRALVGKMSQGVTI